MKQATVTIRQWGNNLGVRIPNPVAKAARVALNQSVRITAEEGRLIIEPVGTRALSLSERLEQFDPARHGGEAMVTARIGAEAV